MPIDIATGNVELDREDFALPGRVPIKWVRSFRSPLLAIPASAIGRGWTTSWFPSLARVGSEWHFTTRTGDVEVFPDPHEKLAAGQVIRLFGSCLELSRRNEQLVVTEWDVESGEIERFVFALRPSEYTFSLVAVENVSGDGVDVKWSPTGLMASLHQRLEDRTVTFEYGFDGRIKSASLVTAGTKPVELVRYEYDDSGRLAAAFDRRGLANRYEYDSHSRLTREILKDGAVYTYRYDEKGRCVHFSGLDHYNEKRLQFIEPTGTTVVTNSYGISSIYKTLPSGQITSETNPNGKQRETIYDEFERIIARVDENGAKTAYTYDAFGNRDSITDALGNVTRFTYNDHHQPTSLTDALGHAWRREYDARNRLVATINPLGARWRIDYDAAGNPATITEPQGYIRRQRFEQGLLRESTDWMDHATTFQWDRFGRITERVGPVGDRTAFYYDVANNPIEVELPDQSRLRATYDSGNNLTSFTTAKGHTVRYRYGACHRLLERVDAIGRSVTYEWGTEPDRLDTVINEKGERFLYMRDTQGRIIRECSFDEREHRFEYDGTGLCIAFTNGNGERIQYHRNPLGRLTKQMLPDGAETTFEYDPIGRILSAVNPDAAVTFEYDAAGQLVRETQNEHWVSTEYNLSGEVIRTATSLDHEARYDLDPNGHVVTLTTGNNQSLSFERDARGLETGRQMPGGMRLEQSFDSMGRLLEQRVGKSLLSPTLDPTSSRQSRIPNSYEVIKRGYSYDPDGLPLSIKDGRWGTTAYTYDPADRLLSALRDQGVSEHFEYDATDNITHSQEERGDDTRAHTRSYGPGNRLLRRNDTRYEYDADGRLIRKVEAANTDNPQVWQHRWDAQGRLLQIQRPDGEVWHYKYDALGRRVSKNGPTKAVSFLWNGDLVIHECQANEKTVTWLTKPGSFAPIARLCNDSLISITTDELGTPRELIDASGAIIRAPSLGVWGNSQNQISDNSYQNCPIRFQGQWFDEESGLHYNRFRYYSPADARYISQDPIGITGTANLYRYVQNPTAWVDPLGLTGDPANATHITYEGVKDGKPYIGYASKPGLGHSAEDVLKYRYPNTDHFDVPPKPFYVGEGVQGKNTARGLEQRTFEARGGLEGTSNRQNPVGPGNKNRDAYLAAADEHLEKEAKACAD